MYKLQQLLKEHVSLNIIEGVIDDCCVAVKKMTLRPYDSDFMEYQYRQFEAEVNILTG